MSTYRIFIRDLTLACRIGILAREKRGPQRLRINVDLLVEWPLEANDDYRRVLNYETVVSGVRGLVQQGHVNLIETLADRIADMCLADPRALAVRVRLEKLDIFPEAEGAGVELVRRRKAPPTGT